ncbi:MAG TPA: hypothetical protein VJZ75_10040 [Candidatus Bathyarchaeia archaeon]|nr:hypothetical protein [Candidatus Bathyarchaeia archaeon]
MRSRIGYALLPIGLMLISVAWLKSFPAGIESRAGYLYDSISPFYWIGLSIANVALFLIASSSKHRWERFVCAVIFFICTYSFTYFFTFPFGSDSNWFRGLTENYASSGVAVWNPYYRWPLLFILGTMTSRVLDVPIVSVCNFLFLTWNVAFVGGLFLYSSQGNPVRDFISIIAYVIAVNPYMPWQFSAQSFALTLLVICLVFMQGKRLPSQVATLLVYAALVLSHAFLPVFVFFTAAIASIKHRAYLKLAIIFLLLYSFYVVIETPQMISIALSEYAQLYFEYALQGRLTLAGPVSSIDALGRTASLLTTFSMWALLGFATYSCWIHRKFRAIDIPVHLSAAVYAVVGIIGWRALQIFFIPTTHAIRTVIVSASTRKFLRAYFLLALAIFPLALLHRTYNVQSYMTYREQHAADVIFISTFQADPNAQNSTMMVRDRMLQWIKSQSNTQTIFIDEYSPPRLLEGTAWFKFIVMSPELEKDLVNIAGLSDSQLSQMEGNTVGFSRIYSNGHVTVLMNPNATEAPAGPIYNGPL